MLWMQVKSVSWSLHPGQSDKLRLKFPVFEVINRAMAFSGLPASISGVARL